MKEVLPGVWCGFWVFFIKVIRKPGLTRDTQRVLSLNVVLKCPIAEVYRLHGRHSHLEFHIAIPSNVLFKDLSTETR